MGCDKHSRAARGKFGGKALQDEVNATQIGFVTPNGIAFEESSQDLKSNASFSINNPPASNAAIYATQVLPATELRFLSQPSGFPQIDYFQNYVYKRPVKEVFVYVAELGVNDQHIDFSSRQVEWLYTKLATALNRNIPVDDSTDGHSTCVASQAIGTIYGAAKGATLVAVKMADLSEGSVIEVFPTILNDIQTKGRQGRSVVLVSWGSKSWSASGELDSPLYSLMKRFVQQMADQNIIIVAGAGNHASRNLNIDTVPAVFANSIPLIAVSGCDFRGQAAAFSQRLLGGREIFPPGVDITCADARSTTDSRRLTGTSCCK